MKRHDEFGNVDDVTVEQVLAQLQQMDMLRDLNDTRYSPGLVDIIKNRYDQNVAIEGEFREWAALEEKEKYPYPKAFVEPTLTSSSGDTNSSAAVTP